jgi:hypothetical protein
MIQAKLTVNAPGDEYEQEADRVAEEVMATPAVQRAELEGEDEKPEVMTKPQPSPAAGGAFEAGDEFQQQLDASRGRGQPLPDALMQDFETKFGADFGGVRIHTDVESDQLNRSVQAKAFTAGQDIFFREGAYEPASRPGQELIAHELTHVMQQRATNGHENHLIQRRVGFEFENTGIRLVKGDLENYKKDLTISNQRNQLDKVKNWEKALATRYTDKYRNLKRKEEVIEKTFFTLEADDTVDSNVEFVLHGDRRNAQEEEKAGFTFQQRKEMSDTAKEAAALAQKIEDRKNEPFSAEILSTAAPKDVIVHKLRDPGYLFQATAGIRPDRITYVFSKGQSSGLFQTGSFDDAFVKKAKAAIEAIEGVPEHARSLRLTNLLTLVTRYIVGARAYKEGGNIKEITPMMARTDFGRLYSLLPRRTKDYFTEKPERWVELVHSALSSKETGYTLPSEAVEEERQFSETDITNWLRGMPLGKDLWKGLDPDESMGGLGKRTDPGNPKNVEALNRQAIFEFRHMRGASPTTFVKDCQDFFDYVADLNDERSIRRLYCSAVFNDQGGRVIYLLSNARSAARLSP